METMIDLGKQHFSTRVLLRSFAKLESDKPLSSRQVRTISKYLKDLYIHIHFRFSGKTTPANKELRANLLPIGMLYTVSNLRFSEIPSFIADLLRYKRHEWSIFVIADKCSAKYFFCHKGQDSDCVLIPRSLADYVANIAVESNCSTVLHFHNHPKEKLIVPSPDDLNCFKKMKKHFCRKGLNFLSGIVSRGNFSIYANAFADAFTPEHCSAEEVQANIAKNGPSGIGTIVWDFS